MIAIAIQPSLKAQDDPILEFSGQLKGVKSYRHKNRLERLWWADRLAGYTATTHYKLDTAGNPIHESRYWFGRLNSRNSIRYLYSDSQTIQIVSPSQHLIKSKIHQHYQDDTTVFELDSMRRLVFKKTRYNSNRYRYLPAGSGKPTMIIHTLKWNNESRKPKIDTTYRRYGPDGEYRDSSTLYTYYTPAKRLVRKRNGRDSIYTTYLTCSRISERHYDRYGNRIDFQEYATGTNENCKFNRSLGGWYATRKYRYDSKGRWTRCYYRHRTGSWRLALKRKYRE